MNEPNLAMENLLQQSEAVPLNSKQAKSLMVEKAKELVNRLIESRKHSIPPFQPKEYLNFVNIKEIQKRDLGTTSGLLLKFNNGYVIRVNQNHHKVRQSFSCAHEIGHILFDELHLLDYVHSIEYRTYNPARTNEMQSREIEKLCDAAAAELLMPESVFKSNIYSYGLSITAIEQLASIFEVSIQAAARRIAEVSDEPCIAAIWSPWPTFKPRGLRSSSLYGRSNRYILVNQLVNEKSAIYKAYQNNVIVKSRQQFKCGSIVSSLPYEAKGFGPDEARYVISFAFPARTTDKNK